VRGDTVTVEGVLTLRAAWPSVPGP